LRQHAGQGLVEPQPPQILWQSQGMSTELHARCAGPKPSLGIRYTVSN